MFLAEGVPVPVMTRTCYYDRIALLQQLNPPAQS
jgi:hypothetical protein